MRGSVPLVVALLMASAAFLPVAHGASAKGVAVTWEVALTIDSQSAGAQKMFEAFDTASLNLYDFNGDGQLEIVSNNDNNRAYVIDSRTGRVLTEIANPNPMKSDKWPVRDLNPVAIGELYGDGVPCLVIPSSAAYMEAWCFNAAASTGDNFVFDKKWQVTLDAEDYEPDFKEKHPWLYDENGTKKAHPGADGHAYLADADGDGKQEVFVETDGYPGQFAFNHDGSYRWSRSFADGNGGAIVKDIDADGKKEAVFVSDAGLVVSYDADDGSIEWVFDSDKYGAWPGSIPVAPLVADLHGDGTYEIVFGTRNVSRDYETNPNWINESHARYFALDSKGKVLWSVSYDWMNPLQYNNPAPADINGDGVLDVVFFDWNTVGHKPGGFDSTNRHPNLFALDGRDGSELWHTPVNNYWSNKDFVIADVNGDSDYEVIVPNPRGPDEGLGVYDLKDGRDVGWFPIDWTISRGPVAGDLYNDGQMYLVVPVMKSIKDRENYRSLDVGYREGQLRIVKLNAPYDVLFSANLLHNEDQEDTMQKGSSGEQPAPTTPDEPNVPTAPDTIEPSPEPSEDEDPPTPPSDGGMPIEPGLPSDGSAARSIPAPGVALGLGAVALGFALRRRGGRGRA